MATQFDTSPFIDLSQYGRGFIPSSAYAGNRPTSGGNQQPNRGGIFNDWFGSSGGMVRGAMDQMGMLGGMPIGTIADLASGGEFDPLSFFTGGLFGGDDENKWKPYVDPETGMYVWNNPNTRNPVPLANVPGASLKPSKTYQQTAQNIQAMSDLFPYYNAAINAAKLPSSIADFNASAATSGPYAALMTSLYNQYGPQLNAIGQEIARRNALGQASTDLEVMQGPGRDLVRAALETAKEYDPEYFATRELTANRLKDLMNSVDLSGALSPTERDEVTKGLARQNMQAGTFGTPNQTNTVTNAMQYGNAGYQRKQQAFSNLSNAIQSANAFLPASRSGVDVFQVATGRSSVPNTGNSLFPGIQNASQQGSALGQQLFGGLNSLQQSNNQIEANKKDWLDKMNQITSSVKDIGSTVGSFAGMMGGCWVAREVYGIDNPDWLRFRHWMMNIAPNWFRNLYMKYGERFAKFISNKPLLKKIIKKWMDTKI